MKSLIILWKQLAYDLASWCCTSATHDCKTVMCRTEHEGLSFLTITLPEFGKDFEKSLDQGQVDHASFAGFRRRGGLPLFLGGFLDLVFDRSSGSLLDDPNIDAIYAIRQLTLVFGKIELKCSDTRVRASYDRFVECDNEVSFNSKRTSFSDLKDFVRVGELLFGDVFEAGDWKVFDRDIVPKHGPGATADRLRGNAKYRQRSWPVRLQEILPWEDFLIPNSSYTEEIGPVDLVEPETEIPVKVITVPKTMKTPRIIAIEPTAMQYAQQAVQAMLREEIGKVYHLRHFLGFDDQVPNQDMARLGSENGQLATLDLSEASDRVSMLHVRALMSQYPHLMWAVEACRSRKATVPFHGEIPLNKYASMGSALTFPIEAMVFLTMVFIGIERELSEPLDPAKVRTFVGKVRIYGDDIIVPVDYVESVVRVLETFGSKVNTGKSFWTGKFRESCGKEYYDGVDVSIVRVRHKFPAQRTDHTGVTSLVSLRNQLYKAGRWSTCKWLDDKIRRVLRHFPVVLESSPVVGRHSFLGYETQRMHPTLHSPMVKGYVSASVIPVNPLDGHDALLKWFIIRNDLPVIDENHLKRSGRPLVVDIKLGWGSAV